MHFVKFILYFFLYLEKNKSLLSPLITVHSRLLASQVQVNRIKGSSNRLLASFIYLFMIIMTPLLTYSD